MGFETVKSWLCSSIYSAWYKVFSPFELSTFLHYNYKPQCVLLRFCVMNQLNVAHYYEVKEGCCFLRGHAGFVQMKF